MKCPVVAIALATVVCMSCCGSEHDRASIELSGVWTVWPGVNQESLSEATYSWGPGITVRNGSIDIDLGHDPPTLRLGYLGGTFDVTEVERINESTYRIVFWFARGGFAEEWTVHKVDENTVYFLQESGGLEIEGIFGPENPHYRIDGPDIEDPPEQPAE